MTYKEKFNIVHDNANHIVTMVDYLKLLKSTTTKTVTQLEVAFTRTNHYLNSIQTAFNVDQVLPNTAAYYKENTSGTDKFSQVGLISTIRLCYDYSKELYKAQYELYNSIQDAALKTKVISLHVNNNCLLYTSPSPRDS